MIRLTKAQSPVKELRSVQDITYPITKEFKLEERQYSPNKKDDNVHIYTLSFSYSNHLNLKKTHFNKSLNFLAIPLTYFQYKNDFIYYYYTGLKQYFHVQSINSNIDIQRYKKINFYFRNKINEDIFFRFFHRDASVANQKGPTV